MPKEARPMSIDLFGSLATALVAWYKPAGDKTRPHSAFDYRANALIRAAIATMPSGGA